MITTVISCSSNITGVMDDRIRSLCHLYLGWNKDQIMVRPLGKGCTNNVIIASLNEDLGSEVRQRNQSLVRDGIDGLCKDNNNEHQVDHYEQVKDHEGFLGDYDCNRVENENEFKKVTKEVLVKLYGSVIPGKLATDVYVNCYLGSLGRVPKILGLFEGGRIEEFLPSTCITHDNFRLQYRKIVKMTMEFQNLSMPVPREIFLVKQLREFSERVTEDKEFWKAEVDWFLDILDKIGSDLQLSFCHNDVSMNNLLVPNSEPDNLVLIDWEYASFNYSLYDIANYCCQLQYDLSHPVAPYFLFNDQWLPCDAVLLDVLNIYKTSTSPPNPTPYMELLAQLKFMIMGSELFWTLWALTLEVSFNIDLTDYLAAKRNGYFQKKELYADVIAELVAEKSFEKSADSPQYAIKESSIREELIY